MGAPQYEQAGADVAGSGTTNTIPRWTGPTTLGNSGLIDDGTQIYTTTRNVGIGTASPSTRLHVSDNSSITMILQSSGSTDSYLRFINTANNLGYIGYVGTNLYLAPNNGAGNVGIGTASPSTNLHIANAATTQIKVQMTGQCDMRVISDTGYGAIGTYSNMPLLFRTNSAEVARIDSSGNVGIGTTSPTAGRALTTVADLDVFGVRVGRGAGNDAESTALGAGALAVQTSGARYNTAIGRSALTTVAGGRFNTAVGWSALKLVTSGENNTAIGIDALGGIDTTSQNAAVGREAGRYISGGGSLTAASDSVFLGYNARANANSESNQIVIGAGATGNGSNTVTIGNSSNVGTFLDTKYVRIVDSYTVATLPVAGTAGRIARVTDGDAGLAWGATVVNTGAGATPYLVWDNGTNWTVFGK